MATYLNILLVLGLFGLLIQEIQCSSSLQCTDENGKPLDWYIVYKFPYLLSTHRKLFGGYRYATLTSDAPEGWHLSTHNISQRENSIFAETLSPIYGGKNSKSKRKLYSLFYSDQPPTDTSVSSYYAHSKGLLVSDEKQGFWLIHTVPKFSPNDSVSIN